MADIIGRFADGRLLVKEEKLLEQGYKMSGYSTYGVPFRIGHLRVVEHVVSVDAHVSGYGGIDGRVLAPLKEVRTSGDTLLIVMRRGDIGPVASGLWSGLASGLQPVLSGESALSVLSGITSGLGHWGELTSGLTAVSGLVNVVATVVGY